MPMMQFSVAPWRILDSAHLDAVKKAVQIRKKFTAEILELARESAQTGEPIISPVEYFFPNQGYDEIKDQFMLGNAILVAPMDKKETSRKVVFPKGKWLSDDGRIYKGGTSYTIDVPLFRLPYFVLQK
jgi:alpha-glucosidase